jgi:hypothetical protein
MISLSINFPDNIVKVTNEVAKKLTGIETDLVK